MIISKTNTFWFNLWQACMSLTKMFLTHFNGFIFLHFLFASDKPLHWLLPNMHVSSFFQTTGQAHCNLSKNPDPSGSNRDVWFYSMLRKSINQEKIAFLPILEPRKKICQPTCYLPIQSSVKDTGGKHTVNQGCVKKPRQAFNINQINM